MLLVAGWLTVLYKYCLNHKTQYLTLRTTHKNYYILFSAQYYSHWATEKVHMKMFGTILVIFICAPQETAFKNLIREAHLSEKRKEKTISDTCWFHCFILILLFLVFGLNTILLLIKLFLLFCSFFFFCVIINSLENSFFLSKSFLKGLLTNASIIFNMQRADSVWIRDFFYHNSAVIITSIKY